MTQDEIKEALETCILGYCTGCPYDGCDGDCRDELHKDVLTLITEQEKEIERLKAEKKQAKIDVLNELREKYATSGSVNSNWATIIFVDDIDELIKEIENDKCNC